MLENKPVMAE